LAQVTLILLQVASFLLQASYIFLNNGGHD